MVHRLVKSDELCFLLASGHYRNLDLWVETKQECGSMLLNPSPTPSSFWGPPPRITTFVDILYKCPNLVIRERTVSLLGQTLVKLVLSPWLVSLVIRVISTHPTVSRSSLLTMAMTPYTSE